MRLSNGVHGTGTEDACDPSLGGKTRTRARSPVCWEGKAFFTASTSVSHRLFDAQVEVHVSKASTTVPVPASLRPQLRCFCPHGFDCPGMWGCGDESPQFGDLGKLVSPLQGRTRREPPQTLKCGEGPGHASQACLGNPSTCSQHMITGRSAYPRRFSGQSFFFTSYPRLSGFVNPVFAGRHFSQEYSADAGRVLLNHKDDLSSLDYPQSCPRPVGLGRSMCLHSMCLGQRGARKPAGNMLPVTHLFCTAAYPDGIFLASNRQNSPDFRSALRVGVSHTAPLGNYRLIGSQSLYLSVRDK